MSFLVPSKPTPRQRYSHVVEWYEDPELRPGTWRQLEVSVFEGPREVGKYKRNYPNMYRTFEPFRQDGKDYALISPHYTGTSVMDLQTGEIIAQEPKDSFGFCPVGFYVPNWWDANDEDDESEPDKPFWNEEEREFPTGQFGFVWGCIWGDDSGPWKVQYLDLSQITSGVITREERFGYLPLDTRSKDAKDFIRFQYEELRSPRVVFSVPRTYDLGTGKLLDRD